GGRGGGGGGGGGRVILYSGRGAGPMSVVAPVSGLAATILPVTVALADGERPGDAVYAGALLCLIAIVLASSATDARPAGGTSRLAPSSQRGSGRAVGYGIVSGTSFGLFFIL